MPSGKFICCCKSDSKSEDVKINELRSKTEQKELKKSLSQKNEEQLGIFN